MARSKFIIYKDKAGEWRFKMVASNGETVAVSEGYSTKANAIKGIDSIRNNATSALIEEVEN